MIASPECWNARCDTATHARSRSGLAMISRIRLVVILLVLAAPAAARAQGHAQPWSLFSVRYDTRTSDFIYSAYGYGRVFGMVAALDNPRSGYTELIGAVGTTFPVQHGRTQFAAVGVARATDAWYAQLYYLPSLRVGVTTLRATSEMYLPLERAGSVQFALSPLSVTIPVTHAIEAGVATDIAASEGTKTSTGIGPELRLTLPHATLGTDVEQVLEAHSTRFRLFFVTSF